MCALQTDWDALNEKIGRIGGGKKEKGKRRRGKGEVEVRAGNGDGDEGWEDEHEGDMDLDIDVNLDTHRPKEVLKRGVGKDNPLKMMNAVKEEIS